MKKLKLIKATVRENNLKVKKGGFHETSKGDSKEMRKNKKKNIRQVLDEESVTNQIQGYLSNHKTISRDQGKPWYSEKKELKHSLKEAVEKILAEMEKDSDDEGWRKPLPGDLSKRKIPLPARFKEKQLGRFDPETGKRSGLAPARGGFKMTPEEAEEEPKVFEKYFQSKKTPEHRLGLGPRRGFSTQIGGRLGGKAGELVDNYMSKIERAGAKISDAMSKGFEPTPDQQAAVNLMKHFKKMEEDGGKKNIYFFKTHLTSYPMELQKEAGRHAEEKGVKDYEYTQGPGGDTISHLLADNPSPALLMKFMSYFHNPRGFRDVMRMEKTIRDPLAIAGSTGVRGQTVGSKGKGANKGVGFSAHDVRDADIEKDAEELGVEKYTDAIGDLFGDPDEEPAELKRAAEEIHQDDEEKSFEKENQKKRSKSPFQIKMRGAIGSIAEKLEGFARLKGINLSDMSIEDLKEAAPQELSKVVKLITLSSGSPYRKRALEKVASETGESPDTIDFVVEILSQDGETIRPPQAISPQEVQRALGKKFSPEEWAKIKSLMTSVYSVLRPDSLMSKGLYSGSASNVIFDYIMGKMGEYEAGSSKVSDDTDYSRSKIKRDQVPPKYNLKTGEGNRDIGPLTPGKGEEEWSSVDPMKDIMSQDISKMSPEERKRKMFLAKQRHPKDPATIDAALKSIAAEIDDVRKSVSKWGSGRLGPASEKAKSEELKRLEILKKRYTKGKEILQKLTDKDQADPKEMHESVKKLYGRVTTETIKKYLKKRLFEDSGMTKSDIPSLREMLFSAESSTKEKEVEVKEVAWDKAKPEKKKDFYPKLESFLQGRI